MRRLLLIALFPLACSRERETPEPATALNSRESADPLVLRVARGGGTGRIYLYPRLDSAITTLSPLPSINRILAFDADAGSLAFVDARGIPVRVDMRLNESHPATRGRLTALTSADGSNIFGITGKGEVLRLDPSGVPWTYKTPSAPRALLAEPDGSVIIGYQKGDSTVILLLHPPDSTPVHTATLPLIGRAVRTLVGDRIYFTSEAGLVGVKSRDFSLLRPIAFGSRIRALAPTPSGDRLYVATVSEPAITIVDRYTGKIATHLALPSPPADLRVDPLGRYLLARHPTADSAWVIAIGNSRVLGSVATRWATDLPAVAPDGAIAVLGARDVSFVDGESLKTMRTVKNGAKDFWYFFIWDGFRPRAAGLDEPVSFGGDSMAASSTASSTEPSASAESTKTPRDTAAVQPSKTFVVSFAAVLSEARARQLAAEITVNGTAPHVVAVASGNATVYRVALGPFATREEAERIGRSSGRQYWVYEGNP